MRARLAPGASTLAQAARAVSEVAHDGRSADAAAALLEERADRAAVRAIALGTLRWYLRLAPALAVLVGRPPGEVAPLLRSLLVTAAHQIEYSRGAPEVAVHLAVDAARELGLERATGFVNAVLRRFVAERGALLAEGDADPARRSAHPAWLVERLAVAWPAQCETILAAGNAHPPMTLRVDLSRGADLASWLQELAAGGRTGQPVAWRPGAVVLDHPAPVGSLPGFREGRVSVQDAGAQLAAPLLDPRPGQRVLDACAAPGGKTGHLLELGGAIDLLAVDVDPERLERVRETFARLGRTARCRVADLASPGALADEAPFERILVDAPCTSTGVIRRHPDIKLLRRAEDVGPLVELQRRILAQAFARLAPGGRLVYATCSLLPEENEQQVLALLGREPQARLLSWPEALELPPGALHRAAGVQLLPGAAGTDGFYYACLERAGAQA
jgi:16S rRNA (cytosine967-C5)-methyltransferase